MIGPSTAASSQQVPLTNTGTGGNAQQTAQAEEAPQQETTRPAGTSTAQSQQSETRSNGNEDQQTAQASSDPQSSSSSSADRGNTVDITV